MNVISYLTLKFSTQIYLQEEHNAFIHPPLKKILSFEQKTTNAILKYKIQVTIFARGICWFSLFLRFLGILERIDFLAWIPDDLGSRLDIKEQ